MYSLETNTAENLLNTLNDTFAFGFFEGEGILLWFKLMMFFNLLIIVFIQAIGAARVYLTRADYGMALFGYLFIDLIKGYFTSLTMLASPLALIFYYRAFKDALTAQFTPIGADARKAQ